MTHDPLAHLSPDQRARIEQWSAREMAATPPLDPDALAHVARIVRPVLIEQLLRKRRRKAS